MLQQTMGPTKRKAVGNQLQGEEQTTLKSSFWAQSHCFGEFRSGNRLFWEGKGPPPHINQIVFWNAAQRSNAVIITTVFSSVRLLSTRNTGKYHTKL